LLWALARQHKRRQRGATLKHQGMIKDNVEPPLKHQGMML